MNPYYQYQVIKNNLVGRAQCPHCFHRFQIMRKDSQRELSCINCGRKFRLAGNKAPVKHIKRNK